MTAEQATRAEALARATHELVTEVVLLLERARHDGELRPEARDAIESARRLLAQVEAHAARDDAFERALDGATRRLREAAARIAESGPPAAHERPTPLDERSPRD